MNENFKESHLRSLYRFLGHQGHYSRVGSLDVVSKAYSETYISGENEAIKYAQQYNGKRNVFIGRAARNKDGSVSKCCCISFDIDPVRLPGTASTDAQHNQALSAGRRILELFPGGYLSSSGNGCLLLYYTANRVDYNDEYYSKELQFIKYLQSIVGETVKIDSTNYENAVIKAIGTMSTKGSVEERRCSMFYESIMPPYRINEKLINTIQSQTITKESVVNKFEGDPIERLIEAKSCLAKFDSSRCDNYEDWIKVGMALKEFGIAGYKMWKDWSLNSPKYDEAVLKDKWESFSLVPSVSLGSLKYWAKEDVKNETYFTNLFRDKADNKREIRTGFRAIDDALGPLFHGELTTIAARSGFGKTTLACTISERIRKQGHKVLYFSTEMTEFAMMSKFVALSCELVLKNVIHKQLTDTDREKIRNWQNDFEQNPIAICDEYIPSIELFKDKVNQINPDVIVFDHITHISDNWEAIAQYARSIKEFVKNRDIVVLQTVQLADPPRNMKTGEELASIRSDVRGSKKLIDLSAVFIFLANPFPSKTRFQIVDCHIAKDRYGSAGQVVSIQCDKEISKYMEA